MRRRETGNAEKGVSEWRVLCIHHFIVNSAHLVLPTTSYRGPKIHLSGKLVIRAIIDNSRAFNNVDKGPYIYSRCTIYRRMLYLQPKQGLGFEF